MFQFRGLYDFLNNSIINWFNSIERKSSVKYSYVVYYDYAKCT